jgi:simple sugar transport system ATP-binding protein
MTETGKPARLELHGVTKRFGGITALDRVDWTVLDREVHCLVGENGSGKSTLIKVVTGVHAPEPGGRIVFDGRSFDWMTPAVSKGLGIQVIYQDLCLFPNLTVAENIAVDTLLGPAFGTARRAEYRRIADAALSDLGHRLPLDVIVGTLPVADRQIVAIARGMTANATLMIMDEPTASLTRTEVNRLFGLVRGLKARGVATVFVSHRLDEIAEIADRVSILCDGKMSGTYAASEVSDADIAELMSGSRPDNRVRAKAVSREPVLEVQGATRAGEFTDVTLSLGRGEIVGLTGLLGAGRTELALALFGMVPLDTGEIRIDGQRLRLRSNQDAIAAGIAYVSEDRLTLGLNLRQSIADNVAVTVLRNLGNRFGEVPVSRRRTLAETWVQKLGLKADDVSLPVATLSGGNQQRVVLAKWIATDPKVLILDSPTVGVDIRNKQGIYDLVAALAEEGVAILLISDEIPEVYYHADRVLHMAQGRIVAEFVPGKVPIEALREAVHA